MEIVGGVASIITLIEATGVLAEVSRNLVLRWRNAPHQIQALATRLSLLAAELQSIKNATAKSHPVLTDAIIRQSLSDLLTDVRKRLVKLESLHSRLEQCGPMRQKLQWTMKDAGAAEKMLNKTQEIEQRLANLMTLISLRAQTPILDGLDRIEQMVSTLVIALPASVPVAPAMLSTFTANTTGNTPTHTGSGCASKRTLVTFPWTAGKVWETLGVRGAIVTTQKGYHTDYNIRFSISLPLARIIGSYALKGCLLLRSTSLCRSFFTFRHPSYFAVARVVDRDHPFMSACRDGDIETVRFMLRSGKGRPTDVDARGITPMSLAAQSGKIEVVAELLECGVEVDAIVDLEYTCTMLEISSQYKRLDLVRFLLQRGASADHQNSLGVGASALCWQGNDLASTQTSMDIYNVLSESTYIDLRGDDRQRAVAVQVAAMAGCGSHIDILVRFGYDIYRDEFGPETMLGYAAKHGNFSAYLALISHFGGAVFGEGTYGLSYLLKTTILGKYRRLVRGTHWSGENDEVLRDILQRCGGDRLLPLPTDHFRNSELPVTLSKEMTANELVAALGPETEVWYLGMVRSCGFLSVDEEKEVMQRLRELSTAGFVTAGFVYECEGEPSNPGGDRGGGREDWSEDSALAEEEIPEDSNTDVDGGHERDTESEDDGANQFWDAPESV